MLCDKALWGTPCGSWNCTQGYPTTSISRLLSGKTSDFFILELKKEIEEFKLDLSFQLGSPSCVACLPENLRNAYLMFPMETLLLE